MKNSLFTFIIIQFILLILEVPLWVKFIPILIVIFSLAVTLTILFIIYATNVYKQK